MATDLPLDAATPAPQPAARARRQKRAAALTLTLMAAAPVVVLSWDPLYRDMRLFSAAQACGGPLTEQQCRQAMREVERRNARLAPSYARFVDCEHDFARARQECPAGTWCDADVVLNCATDDAGLAYPRPAGFMLGASLLERLRSGEAVDWSAVTDDQLQPVYTLGSDDPGGLSDGGGYYASSHAYRGVGLAGGHLFNRHGQYLGAPGTARVNLHYRFLSGAERLHHTSAGITQGGLPSRFYAGNRVQRGGFGATARSSMSSAIG